jgi:hypothetical protein
VHRIRGSGTGVPGRARAYRAAAPAYSLDELDGHSIPGGRLALGRQLAGSRLVGVGPLRRISKPARRSSATSSRAMRLARAAGLARPQRKSPSSSTIRPARHNAASKPPMVQAAGRQRPDRGVIDDLRLDPRSAITRGPQQFQPSTPSHLPIDPSDLQSRSDSAMARGRRSRVRSNRALSSPLPAQRSLP